MHAAFYAAEAARTLGMPAEMGSLFKDFEYDPDMQQWCFEGYYIRGHKSSQSAAQWVEKICTWLQRHYPRGPEEPTGA